LALRARVAVHHTPTRHCSKISRLRGFSAALLGLLASACGRIGYDELARDGSGGADASACASLVFSPAAPRTNLNTVVTLRASGGTPPYVYALVQGGGVVGGIVSANSFLAPGEPGKSKLSVADAAGCVAYADVTYGGDFLFYVGGQAGGVATDEVWRSGDGVTWTPSGVLPGPRSSGALLVYVDRLWFLGGTDAAGTRRDEVWSSADGMTWTLAGTLPVPMSAPAATVMGGMWLAGGYNNQDRVWTSGDGAQWSQLGPLPMVSHGGVMVVHGGRMWHLGGHDDSSGTFYDQTYSSVLGVTWSPGGRLATPREYVGATVFGGRIWLAGGTGSGTFDDVLTSDDGTAWVTSGTLPSPRARGAMTGFQDRVWFVGGDDGGGPWSAVAPGAWTTAPGNLGSRNSGGLAAFTPAGT